MTLAGGEEAVPAAGVAGRSLRAEIDSLRAENDELRMQNRERDRELADEREKSERVRFLFPSCAYHLLTFCS